MKIAFVAAVTLAFASLGAHAAPAPSPEAETAEAAGGASKVKMRCIREREVGSNRVKKLCLPAERFKTLTQEEKDAMIRSDKGVDILDN